MPHNQGHSRRTYGYWLPLTVLLCIAVSAQSPPAGDPDQLLDAARSGDRDRVAALLDSGAGVNAATRYGVSALGFAAERGHFDIVRLLVERGADVNVADVFYGSRPIDFALRSGQLDIAVYLLEHGSQGAVSVLNTAIRRKDAKAVTVALGDAGKPMPRRWRARGRSPARSATPRLSRW